jgi:hypothetical protein
MGVRGQTHKNQLQLIRNANKSPFKRAVGMVTNSDTNNAQRFSTSVSHWGLNQSTFWLSDTQKSITIDQKFKRDLIENCPDS